MVQVQLDFTGHMHPMKPNQGTPLLRVRHDTPGTIGYGGPPGGPATAPEKFFDQQWRLDPHKTAPASPHSDRPQADSLPERKQDRTHAPRAVVFDFGNVICSFDVGRFIQNFSTMTGKNPEELKNAVRNSIPLIREYESGMVSTDEFIAAMNRTAGVSLSAREFRQAYCDIFTPIPETVRLIRSLKSRYRLGLLSNTNALHFDCAIRPMDIFALFDTVTLSYEVRAMKPARLIYEDALQKLALPSEQCVYIDDLQENIQAAAGLGFRAIHYTSHQRLLEDLHRAGVHTDDAQPRRESMP